MILELECELEVLESKMPDDEAFGVIEGIEDTEVTNVTV